MMKLVITIVLGITYWVKGHALLFLHLLNLHMVLGGANPSNLTNMHSPLPTQWLKDKWRQSYSLSSKDLVLSALISSS